jgi:rubrerythrin
MKSALRNLALVAIALMVAGSAVAATTLENLQTAYNGESNAQTRYLAFAAKAQDEGYLRVASLFRAAARSEQVHVRNHAEVIRKMGGTPRAEVKAPAVKTTLENLQSAIEGEKYESEQMYPGFLAQARAEKNTRAVRTFNLARQVESVHATLYSAARANLNGWKAAAPFYVCPVCGNTVAVLGFEMCPICFTRSSKFEKVT